MIAINDMCSKLSRPPIRSKAGAVVTAIQQISEKFIDLLTDILILEEESNTYKDQLLKQKEKCESKTCRGSEELKNVIQLAASTAVTLNETKNLSFINELLKVLCGEVPLLTPPIDPQDNKENFNKTTPLKSPKKKSKKVLSPRKEFNTSAEESFNEESVSEIEGTPGRTSPIIGTKILKSSSSISTLSGNSVHSSEKKKCPSSWHTPETKLVKLASPPKGATRGRGGRSRQCRLTTFLAKPTHVVDLTCSPVGSTDADDSLHNSQINLQMKHESSDNDDTILPSPTSCGPTNNMDITSKQHSKDIPKSKKTQLSLKKESPDRTEEPNSTIIANKKLKYDPMEDLEHSSNILPSSRFTKSPFKVKSKQSPRKEDSISKNKIDLELQETPKKTITIGPNDKTPEILDKDLVVGVSEILVKEEMLDVTHCNDVSVSILQHVEGMDAPKLIDEAENRIHSSPFKRPLEENKNYLNMPQSENRISPPKPETFKKIEYKPKRKYLQKPEEPVYKEPTVRKKAEKMALPGWCCQECVNFFGDLYEDDPDKIAKIVARCSKHRGRNNPVRPPTPPGFWQPRWDVPTDIAEFNARNNAH